MESLVWVKSIPAAWSGIAARTYTAGLAGWSAWVSSPWQQLGVVGVCMKHPRLARYARQWLQPPEDSPVGRVCSPRPPRGPGCPSSWLSGSDLRSPPQVSPPLHGCVFMFTCACRLVLRTDHSLLQLSASVSPAKVLRPYFSPALHQAQGLGG